MIMQAILAKLASTRLQLSPFSIPFMCICLTSLETVADYVIVNILIIITLVFRSLKRRLPVYLI